MELTLNLVWNGEVDRNHRLMTRSELEKALSTSVNKEKLKNKSFLLEDMINVNPSDINTWHKCDMNHVIGYIKSFDLDNFKVNVVITDPSTCIKYIHNCQVAFKKSGLIRKNKNCAEVYDVIVSSCYLIDSKSSSRIDKEN